jgi:V/A-type H+-transporting ATPase subunit A
MLREGFLQQDAYDSRDSYCLPEKQFKMLRLIVDFYELCEKALSKGVPLSKIRALPQIKEIFRIKYTTPNEKLDGIDALHTEIIGQLNELMKGGGEIKVAV